MRGRVGPDASRKHDDENGCGLEGQTEHPLAHSFSREPGGKRNQRNDGGAAGDDVCVKCPAVVTDVAGNDEIARARRRREKEERGEANHGLPPQAIANQKPRRADCDDHADRQVRDHSGHVHERRRGKRPDVRRVGEERDESDARECPKRQGSCFQRG